MRKIIILFLCFAACKKHTPSINESIKNRDTLIIDSNDFGANMLKDFYYSCYLDDGVINDKDLKRKFVSTTILERIDSLRNGENLILDYDPFIKGQDYSHNAIKNTLEIKPLKNKNEFRVSFFLFDDENEKKINVDFLLEKNEKGDFVIASILNDKYLNIKRVDKNLDAANKIDSGESLSKWFGNYKGSFLRMKDESADPRGWATINIKLSKDSLSFYLFSYLEEKNLKLKLIKANEKSITLNMGNNNTLKINNRGSKNKYTLESSYINNLLGERKIVELSRKKI
ncbi:DUF3828 domain-containing protein [Flavobacterium sp. PS2]|uniref:DUF3828 domain-containing protein n=1 Tax=Flavobacterium sp. PS2 TaxID=3384157 RepID=UPI00390CBD4A